MPTRDELHTLIDSMPQGALDAARQMLSNLQTWPPPSLPGMEEMKSRRDEMRKRQAEHLRPGTLTSFGGGGRFNLPLRTGSSGMSQWEGDTFVAQTYRYHLGHELLITEGVRLDGQQLIYSHSVTGPGDKSDTREVVFEIR
jgi:hypothetical protein